MTLNVVNNEDRCACAGIRVRAVARAQAVDHGDLVLPRQRSRLYRGEACELVLSFEVALSFAQWNLKVACFS